MHIVVLGILILSEQCGERALAHLERVVKLENPDSVAAILFEGESGSSGCLKYPPMYLKTSKRAL